MIRSERKEKLRVWHNHNHLIHIVVFDPPQLVSPRRAALDSRSALSLFLRFALPRSSRSFAFRQEHGCAMNNCGISNVHAGSCASWNTLHLLFGIREKYWFNCIYFLFFFFFCSSCSAFSKCEMSCSAFLLGCSAYILNPVSCCIRHTNKWLIRLLLTNLVNILLFVFISVLNIHPPIIINNYSFSFI